jgi:hypothetical protein
VIWLGNEPTANIFTKSKKGNSWEMMQLVFQDRRSSFEISVDKVNGDWLLQTLDKINIHQKDTLTFNQLKADYELTQDNFELFWYSKPMKILKENGLLVL